MLGTLSYSVSRSRADFDSPGRSRHTLKTHLITQRSRLSEKLEGEERSLFSQDLPQKHSLHEVTLLVEQIESKMADYHAMVESLASTVDSIQLNLSSLSRLNQQTANSSQCFCKNVKASFNNLLNHTNEISKCEVVEMLTMKLQEIAQQKQHTSILDLEDDDADKQLQKASEVFDLHLLEEHRSESTPTHSRGTKMGEKTDLKGQENTFADIQLSEASSEHSSQAQVQKKAIFSLPQYRPLIPAQFVKSNHEFITLTGKSKKHRNHLSDKAIRRKNDDSLGDTAPPESPDRQKRPTHLHRLQSTDLTRHHLFEQPGFPAPMLEERKLSLFCPEALRHTNEIGSDLVEADATKTIERREKQTSSKKAILKKPSLSKKKSEEEAIKTVTSSPEGKKQARFADRSSFK